MPFVVTHSRPDSKVGFEHPEFEKICKEVWWEVNHKDCDGTYHKGYGCLVKKESKSDVGGVTVITADPSIQSGSFKMSFYYVGRGQDFNDSLLTAFNKRFGESDRVTLIPTKSEFWFADPVWATKIITVTGKCQRVE